MAAMVNAYRRLIMSLVGQKLQAGNKRQDLLFLHVLSAELAWDVLRLTSVGPDPGLLSCKINLLVDQYSR
jgi:hypothetical protein